MKKTLTIKTSVKETLLSPEHNKAIIKPINNFPIPIQPYKPKPVEYAKISFIGISYKITPLYSWYEETFDDILYFQAKGSLKEYLDVEFDLIKIPLSSPDYIKAKGKCPYKETNKEKYVYSLQERPLQVVTKTTREDVSIKAMEKRWGERNIK